MLSCRLCSTTKTLNDNAAASTKASTLYMFVATSQCHSRVTVLSVQLWAVNNIKVWTWTAYGNSKSDYDIQYVAVRYSNISHGTHLASFSISGSFCSIK